ncbi:MAG TPA: GNAT family N-acetyltransferase [Xanthobacteraceae bacterium]|nr:GNAT family N-acetyltransferase [Xanthobacteraceae bacterium]
MMPPVTLRDATRHDVIAIVAMLADDALGASREVTTEPLPASYYAAFDALARDPNNRLLIAEINGEIVGTMQITFIHGLSRQGAKRALIEAVRVASLHRGKGIGEQIIREAIEMARREGCAMVQLTSDKSRKDAHRFYERLGFVTSHEGMKLTLD